jgi:hypothetical protein
MKPQLMEKLWQYINAGWWIPKTAPQAAPLLCIPKKTGKLRTVVDCRQCNDNMVKDVTPFPDQDQIRMDIAQAKFRSKIDLSNAYEQVHIEPDDISKTAFAMVFGMFKSNVMQQGDCNAPATFQLTGALAGPSWVIEDSDAAVHQSAEDHDVQLDYENQPDEDTSMGPG